MSFSRVAGHETVIENLRRLIRSDRLAHAYLFAGPDGVGKFLTAVAFAQAILCPSSAKTGDACGKCPGCVRVDSGNHSDLTVFQPEVEGRQFVADLVEQLQSQIPLKPRSGNRRVFILRDVHEMNATAANRLLKTLEEPPSHALLILVTSSVHALPETILSRCRLVRFGALPAERVIQALSEKAGARSEDAAWLSRFAAGSVGQALRLAEGPLRNARAEMLKSAASAHGMSHIALSDALSGLADAAGKSAFERRAFMCQLLALLAGLYRDAALMGMNGSIEGCLNQDVPDIVRGVSARSSPEVNANHAERCLDAARCIAQNANVTMILDGLAQDLAGG
ncbi:MAG TPA: DNA polymerase III subunit delta' [Candidatus Brocadiia bacterium]|nr:DNA polymerase III subunit delta' [Candidatus Brocadiia bacterium]